MRKLIVLLFLVVLTGCKTNKPETYTYKDVGALTNIDHLTTSFNERNKCRVETTKGVFILDGDISGIKGSQVTLRSDGYLFIDGTDYGFAVYGYRDLQ